MLINPSTTTSSKSATSDAPEWRRFAKATFFGILLPSVLLFSCLEWVAWSIGETRSPASVAAEQGQNPKVVWMGARLESRARFKLARVAATRPDVLIMGQSRMTQVRAAMFRPYSCYNLSCISYRVSTYVEILRHLPDGYKPKVIFLGVDFFTFSPLFTAAWNNPLIFETKGWSEHFVALNDVRNQLFQTPRLIWTRHAPYYRNRAYGLRALEIGNANRFDGSEQWPAGMIKSRTPPTDAQCAAILERMIPGGAANTIGRQEMKAFAEFLALAHAKGISVIGVQMPMFLPTVRLLESAPDYVFLRDFRARVAAGCFSNMGMPFFDFLRFPGAECFDYCGDPVHPNEPLTAAALLAMGDDPQVAALLPKWDRSALRRMIEENRKADQHIYLRIDEP